MGYECRIRKNTGLNINVGYKLYNVFKYLFWRQSAPVIVGEGPYSGGCLSITAKYYFNNRFFVGPIARMSYMEINDKTFRSGSKDEAFTLTIVNSQRTDFDIGAAIGFAGSGKTSNFQFFVAGGLKNIWANTSYTFMSGSGGQHFYRSSDVMVLNGYVTSGFFQLGTNICF
jgi:hypothetical protein